MYNIHSSNCSLLVSSVAWLLRIVVSTIVYGTVSRWFKSNSKPPTQSDLRSFISVNKLLVNCPITTGKKKSATYTGCVYVLVIINIQDSEIVLFCTVLWQMEMGTLFNEHPVFDFLRHNYNFM